MLDKYVLKICCTAWCQLLKYNIVYTKKWKKKGHKGTLEGVAYVCYIDCGDASQVFAHVQSHQIAHVKYVISLYIH